jgi:GNAT superfamily N-acetyltransferase
VATLLDRMQMRRATIAEAPGIAALVERYWEIERIPGFDQSRVTLQLQELLSKPERGAGWIADTGSGIVGYLLAVFTFSLEHGGLMAEIDEFFVMPTHRSTGLGASLLEMAEHDLRAAGSVRLQLQLNVDNERAREFYRRRGFQSRAGYELHEKPL